MLPRLVDLRSDTLTKPTPGMRAAMAAAEVGDDVFDEDPTVHALQDRVARLLGKEAALLVPSGSMSNQIGLRVHCAAGDEFICDVNCHVYNYEQGAYAALSGLAVRTVEGREGIMSLEQLAGLVRPDNEHLVRTRLLCIENTHNRGAGRIQPYELLAASCRWAQQSGLRTHLDGARLLNAVVTTGIAAARWAEHFDTVSVCFSKGLGAPVGSALAGTREQIARARRHRKLFGGGMRQAGVLAAAALYALDHHVQRLAEDHAHAQRLAEVVRSLDGLRLTSESVDTNIVIFEVAPQLGTAAEFAARLKHCGVLALFISPTRVRLVTHLDVSADDVEQACGAMEEAARAARAGAPLPEGATLAYA